jgi:hypothetical protein
MSTQSQGCGFDPRIGLFLYNYTIDSLFCCLLSFCYKEGLYEMFAPEVS